MPRSNRPRRKGRVSPSRRDQPPRLELTGMQRAESHPDGEWIVRRVAGSAAGRSYTCPGCQQSVQGGSAHVVAWPAEAPIGAGAAVESRRHWHSACWAARARRGPR